MRYASAIALLAGAACAHAARYTTYIGDRYTYAVSAIAVDANGNTFITGTRAVVLAPGSVPSTQADVFVNKLDASGNLTLLATFSGKGTDEANGIALDPSGNIYIAGDTSSPDFPLHKPLQSARYFGYGYPGDGTGFLVKLSPDGSVLYATYLGGTSGYSSLSAVSADANGNAYVTGTTTAEDYQRTAGMPADPVTNNLLTPISGAFFAKINSDGSAIEYAGALTGPVHTCGGGSSCFLRALSAWGTAIAVDPAGNAYIAGNTSDTGLATTPGALLANGTGAFAVKVNAAGTGLVYATYLGPGVAAPGFLVVTDKVYAIAADAAGNAYLAGESGDPAFPVTPGAFQPVLATNPEDPYSTDAFVAKLNSSGSAMVWATFLGGSQNDAARAISLDPAGNVWVSGTTTSPDFPVTASAVPGGYEFVAEFDAGGSTLTYSALFPQFTVGTALAVDADGTLHVSGGNGLVGAFPADAAPGLSAGPWTFGIANSAGGYLSGRLAPGELFSIYGLHLGPVTPAQGTFSASGFLPTRLAGVQVKINDIPAPLLYVSDLQINAVAPVELQAGAPAALQIVLNGTPLPDFRVMVDLAAPQVFRQPDGSAAAINQDQTINSADHPAKVGSFVSIWATGTGYFPGSDGELALSANEFCNLVAACYVGDPNRDPINVSYVGAAPGMVNGVVQINFQVTNNNTYYLNVDAFNGDSFSVYVAP